MCPPGDTSCGRRADSTYTCKELKQEPVTQNDEGRNGDKENKDEREDLSSWVKNDVGPHDAGDGAAGSEGGQGRMVVEDDMREAGADAANEIEEKVGKMAEVVFHVVAEDPEEEHISSDVQKAAVHEHAGKNREEGGFEAAVAVEREADVVGDGGIGQLEGLVLTRRQCELVKKDDDVRQNEKGVDDRVGPARIQVFERYEHSLACVV